MRLFAVLTFVVLSACSNSSAQTAPNLSLVTGRYLYTSSGYDATGTPLVEVGDIVADGAGHFHLKGWMNTAGQLVRAESQWVYSLDGYEGDASSNVGDVAKISVSMDGNTINMVSANPQSPWLAVFTKDKSAP